MKRRQIALRATVVAVLALGLLAVPLAAGAQPIPRIGLLGDLSWDPLRQGLHDLGYVEGETIVFEDRRDPAGDRYLCRHAVNLRRPFRGSGPRAGLILRRARLLRMRNHGEDHVRVSLDLDASAAARPVRSRLLRWLAEQPVVVCMSTNPEPYEPVRRFDREGTVVSPDAS